MPRISTKNKLILFAPLLACKNLRAPTEKPSDKEAIHCKESIIVLCSLIRNLILPSLRMEVMARISCAN